MTPSKKIVIFDTLRRKGGQTVRICFAHRRAMEGFVVQRRRDRRNSCQVRPKDFDLTVQDEVIHQGQVTVDEALTVARILEVHRRAIETQELEDRLTALEQNVGRNE
ncbi:MAG: hypothetical protein IH808_11480 [Proteobacteria bacterium]|nr:hypothetical protein [Pseudomonadota bacterium]